MYANYKKTLYIRTVYIWQITTIKDIVHIHTAYNLKNTTVHTVHIHMVYNIQVYTVYSVNIPPERKLHSQVTNCTTGIES